MGTATCIEEGRLLEAAGYDAVVAQGSEAGGHRGSFLKEQQPDVGLFSLLPQMCDAVRIPVIASGGVMDGRGIAAALHLGASAVQMGTAFLATAESGATAVWKEKLASASDTSTVVTRTFSGKRARGIRNDFIERMSRYEDELADYPVHNAITGPLRAQAKRLEEPEYQSLWAGQSSSLARKGMAAGDLLKALVGETGEALSMRE